MVPDDPRWIIHVTAELRRVRCRGLSKVLNLLDLLAQGNQYGLDIERLAIFHNATPLFKTYFSGKPYLSNEYLVFEGEEQMVHIRDALHTVFQNFNKMTRAERGLCEALFAWLGNKMEQNLVVREPVQRTLH